MLVILSKRPLQLLWLFCKPDPVSRLHLQRKKGCDITQWHQHDVTCGSPLCSQHYSTHQTPAALCDTWRRAPRWPRAPPCSARASLPTRTGGRALSEPLQTSCADSLTQLQGKHATCRHPAGTQTGEETYRGDPAGGRSGAEPTRWIHTVHSKVSPARLSPLFVVVTLVTVTFQPALSRTYVFKNVSSLL